MFPLDHSARIKLIQAGEARGASAGFSRMGVRGGGGAAEVGRNHDGKEVADEDFLVCFSQKNLFYIIFFITTEL